MARSVVLESLVYDGGYFLRCSVAGLVGPTSEVVSCFVVPFPAMFVVVMDEVGLRLVAGSEGFFYRSHVVHIVLDR